MIGKLNRAIAALVVLTAVFLACRAGMAQLEGMEPPADVTGVDCRMCHTDFGLGFQYPHDPVLNNNCTACHMPKGETKHGALVADDRDLCTSCHTDRRDHYPAATCWSAGCHVEIHGSNTDDFLISRNEEYPGFFSSTCDAEYVGSETCLECHCDKDKWWTQSAHSMGDCDEKTPPERQGCEGCHGPGGNHYGRLAGIGRFEFASAGDSDALCLKCHRDEMYMPDYENSMHFRARVTCTCCHDPHDLTYKSNLKLPPNELCFSCHETKRADFMRLSHHPVDQADPRTGMNCTECHTPHGSPNKAMLVKAADELCVSCHVDKTGPFIYQHAGYDPALGRGCGTCHSHHGANSPNLLMINGRGVCLQCHTDRAQHFAGTDCWASGCHEEHHGSNVNFFFFVSE